MPRHAFTVAEANALLPQVRGTLREIAELREEVRVRVDKLGVLDALWGEKVRGPDNPDHQEYRDHRAGLGCLHRSIEQLVRERLTDRDVRFPVGGLEHGLVDFPTTLDGRWVYLCWRKGESEVAWWHEIDAGFAGRRPLTALEAERMGRADDPARQDDSVLDF